MEYKRRFKVTGGLHKAFDAYKKDNIIIDVNKTKYCSICKDFNMGLSNKLITESFEYKMPYKLGHLRIKAYKYKVKVENGKIVRRKLPVDWKTTKEMWKDLYPNLTKEELKAIPNKKLVLYSNEHTDGYRMRWYWDKRIASIKNQTVYKFEPMKGHQDNKYYDDGGLHYGRLGLAKWIFSDKRNNEYYE